MSSIKRFISTDTDTTTITTTVTTTINNNDANNGNAEKTDSSDYFRCYYLDADDLVSRGIAEGMDEFGEYPVVRDAMCDCVAHIMDEMLYVDWGGEFARLAHECDVVESRIDGALFEHRKHVDDLVALSSKLVDATSKWSQ